MIKFIEGLKGGKKSNLVFFVEDSKDLSLLKDLNLDEKILLRIKEFINKGKNKSIDFSLLGEDYDRLYVFFYSKRDNEEINMFLGDEFRKLPHNFTILSNCNKNIELLLNNAILGRYKYNEYKTKKEDDIIFMIVNKEGKEIAKKRLNTINNIILARRLCEMPANVLYPKTFVKIVEDTKFATVKVKIFDEKKLEKLGMNLVLAVGGGSSKEPYMVVLEKIIDKKLPTIGLVGKGITFDSGGIQVKPDDGMYEMKGDMVGAGTLFALMKELDEKNLNVNIVGALMLAENAIGPNSYRPSDIVKSYSGKTIDISHTDAEGRLILADGIAYLSDNYKLDKLISLASLTGACMRALGYRYSGVMGDCEEFISDLEKYSKKHTEKYWRLPFEDYYVEKTKGEFADIMSINTKVLAGATMGAAFLYNFLGGDEKFVHIDMGGVGYNSYEAFSYVPAGATGYGVDSLSEIIINL